VGAVGWRVVLRVRWVDRMGLVLQVQARVREVDGDDMPSPFTQCGWRTHTRTHQDALSMFTLLYICDFAASTNPGNHIRSSMLH
jgi:hypothetical protein